MYRKHFAMKAYPFDITLNTDELYTSNGLLILLPEAAKIRSGIINYAYHR